MRVNHLLPGLVLALAVVSAWGVIGAARTGPNLSITMTDSSDPVGLGQDLSYTLEITNDAHALASGVTVAYMLPRSISFVSASASQGACLEIVEAVTCALGDMGTESAASVTIGGNPPRSRSDRDWRRGLVGYSRLPTSGQYGLREGNRSSRLPRARHRSAVNTRTMRRCRIFRSLSAIRKTRPVWAKP